MEGELSKKERRAAKRQDVEFQLKSIRRMAIIKTAAIIVVVLGLVFIGVYYAYKLLKQNVAQESIGDIFPENGRAHVQDGVKVEYKTNPPSSGSHYNDPASWGVYDHEIPDEAVLHNLEHGGVWISYKPDIPKSVQEQLIELINFYDAKVILSPRSKNDADIALVSWRRIYKFNLSSDGGFNEELIKKYIKLYKNTGPEFVPDSMPGKAY